MGLGRQLRGCSPVGHTAEGPPRPAVCTEAVGDPDGGRWWRYFSQLVGVFVSPDGS